MRNVEKEAIELATAFNSLYAKYGYPLTRRSSLKESKWWKFFFKAADLYSNLEDWDAYVWVACQFEKHGKRYPPQLIGQEAFDTFQEYKHRFTKTESSKDVALKLLNTHKSILKWCVKTGSDMSLYLKDQLNLFALKRRMVEPTYFTVSKTYLSLDEEVKKRIMSKEDFMIKRASILRNEKLKNKMKELLGDDYG